MALNIENIVAELENSTILELSELVKAIEEKFDVTAAAPVAVAAAGAKLQQKKIHLTLNDSSRRQKSCYNQSCS